MFKIVKNLFGSKETAAPAKPAEEKVAPKSTNPTVKEIIAAANPPAVAATPAKAPEKKPVPAPTPPAKVISVEEVCGITPGMTKDDIRARLALLYRRYNRATSSLDNGLRAEAEKYLDAIVAVREKTFGPI